VKPWVNGFLSSLPICANFMLPDQAIWQWQCPWWLGRYRGPNPRFAMCWQMA
jgi:hypothetical protein